jgi:hypothetical protein
VVISLQLCYLTAGFLPRCFVALTLIDKDIERILMSKYIIVAGGVISGTGKGVSAASLGLLLRLRGHTVTLIKFDPYLNVNAGILSAP